jgi:hypothetical protein
MTERQTSVAVSIAMRALLCRAIVLGIEALLMVWRASTFSSSSSSSSLRPVRKHSADVELRRDLLVPMRIEQ